MPDSNPIVVAIGPSGGTVALQTAFALAEREQAELLLLSVVEPPPALNSLTPHPDMEPSAVQDQLRVRRQSLEEILARSPALSSVRLRHAIVVAAGDPGQEISRVARERHARRSEEHV